MAEEQQQDGQKTIVAFVVGLLIGGMLVWAFSGPSTEAPINSESDDTSSEVSDTDSDAISDDDDTDVVNRVDNTPAPTLQVGDGDIVVPNQPAGTSIELTRAVYPVSEGWVGVREFNNEQLGFILGVVRFSESQGLVPEEIVLQRSTTPGNDYAVVVFTEDGDYDFNLASDVQIDTVFDTFTAE